MVLGQLAACGSWFVKIGLGILLCLALSAVHSLGLEWQREITDVDVYTIQDVRYWGPMTMLVPRNCSLLEELRKTKSPIDLNELPPLSDNNEAPMSWMGYPIMPHSLAVDLVAVHRCNHTIDELDVTWSQYYWAAMFTASSGFGIDELHTSRLRFFWLFLFNGLVVFYFELMETSTKTYRAVTTTPQPDGMSCYAKIAVTVVKQAVSKGQTILQQLMFVSLFVTYWHEDHYLMNYFPGRAYALQLIFVQIPLYMVQWATFMETAEVNPSNFLEHMVLQERLKTNPIIRFYETVYGAFGLLCCCPILLPLIGYSFYNLQFLWTLFRGTASSEAVFSAKFPSLQQTVGAASKHLLGFNVVDAAAAVAADALGAVVAMARERKEEAVVDTEEPLLQED